MGRAASVDTAQGIGAVPDGDDKRRIMGRVGARNFFREETLEISGG